MISRAWELLPIYKLALGLLVASRQYGSVAPALVPFVGWGLFEYSPRAVPAAHFFRDLMGRAVSRCAFNFGTPIHADNLGSACSVYFFYPCSWMFLFYFIIGANKQTNEHLLPTIIVPSLSPINATTINMTVFIATASTRELLATRYCISL